MLPFSSGFPVETQSRSMVRMGFLLMAVLGLSFLVSPLPTQAARNTAGQDRDPSPNQGAVAIRVEDATVSMTQFNKRVQRLSQRYTRRMQRMRKARRSGKGSPPGSSKHPNPQKIKRMAKKQVKRQLISQLVLEVHARKSGVSVSDREVEREWQKLVKRYGSEKKLRQKIKQQPITEAEIREEIRSRLRRRKFVEQNTSSPSVGDTQARQFYDRNKKRFRGRSFQQVKPKIKQHLQRKQRRQAQKKLVQRLKEKTDISVNV